MELMNHFSHDHPLILNENPEDDEDELSCYGCKQPISGPSYGCKRCWFFLHKSCAELPQKMVHPYHREHPLVLLANSPPSYGETREFICDVCRENRWRFTYHCSQCLFDVDIVCALMVLSVQHKLDLEFHDHQVIPIQKPSAFFCDACGTKHEGPSYFCTTCGYWVNQECALKRPTINIFEHHHPHPLTLIYSISDECYRKQPYCKLCDERIYRRHWIYSCLECRYFAHLNCADSAIDKSKFTKHKDEAVSKPKNSDPTKDFSPVHLPMADESTDLTTLFIKNMTQQGNYSNQAEIIHNRDDHMVNFYQEEIKEGEKEDGQCQVCHQTICSPCYKCDQCNFSVHQWCGELPKELKQFPGHLEQHPLFLMNQESTNFFSCECCGLRSNTCFYGCSECHFFLHARCASLPRTIKHKSHKHTLALRLLEDKCCACGEGCHMFGFICESCNYNLCIGCALVPRTIEHRYDDHPFTLIYDISMIDKVDIEYYCEICEEEIDPAYWFYLCKDCDQSVHLKCIPPAWWRFDVRKNRRMVKVAEHVHDLTFLSKPYFGSCIYCEKNDGHRILACVTCKFWLHYTCLKARTRDLI